VVVFEKLYPDQLYSPDAFYFDDRQDYIIHEVKL
jgi:hypothetical protein